MRRVVKRGRIKDELYLKTECVRAHSKTKGVTTMYFFFFPLGDDGCSRFVIRAAASAAPSKRAAALVVVVVNDYKLRDNKKQEKKSSYTLFRSNAVISRHKFPLVRPNKTEAVARLLNCLLNK